MRKFNIGVIGCGNISGIYFENLTNIFENTLVYACSDIVTEKANQASKKYDIPHVMSTEDILNCEDIDIVLNITVPKLHFGICKKALLAGKHVYVEKPLSLTFKQGLELVSIAKEKNLFLSCAPDTFLGGGIQTCRKYIDDGFIGDIIAATAFMTCHGHESWHPDPEFYYKEGGGPMYDMGPYYLTTLVSFLGPAKTISGMTKISFPKRTITSKDKYGDVINVEVPTHIAGTIEFLNGAIVNMITSFDIWDSTLPRIEIYGSLGTLIVPDPNTFGGPVLLKTAHGNGFKEIPLTHIYEENSRGIGISDMAKCIETGETPKTCAELANHVLEMIHGFHESSYSKKYYNLTSTCKKPDSLPLGLIKGTI